MIQKEVNSLNEICTFATSLILLQLFALVCHELGDEIPDGDFNVGYFEGPQHKKKRLACQADLEAMYAHFKGKQHILLWCDGTERLSASDSQHERPRKKKKKRNKETHTKILKVNEQEEQLESVREMHGTKWSGPQYRLWARAIVSGVHDSDNQPPNSPMFTGGLQKQPKESLADAVTGAATAIAKVFSPKQPPEESATGHNVHFYPDKKVDIRMRNLEQLHVLASWKMAF